MKGMLTILAIPPLFTISIKTILLNNILLAIGTLFFLSWFHYQTVLMFRHYRYLYFVPDALAFQHTFLTNIPILRERADRENPPFVILPPPVILRSRSDRENLSFVILSVTKDIRVGQGLILVTCRL
jgi:hypothetical protein